MNTVAHHIASSSAPPQAFYSRWVDHASWPQWDIDTEWVRLEGPLVEGVKGKLKSKGGPAVGFQVARLVSGREYTDLCRFPGAKMTFQHLAEAQSEGSRLEVLVNFQGPLSWLWARTVGKGIAKGVLPALKRLIELVEAQER